MKKPKFIPLLISFSAVVLAACSAPASAGELPDLSNLETAPAQGALAPDFELQLVGGDFVHLSDYLGQAVLVNFWATWCGPCRIEMPAIQARYDTFSPDFVVLAVDFDEPVAAVADFVDELSLTFPVLLDPGAVVNQEYQVRGYPSSYFVDQNGIIQVVHIGIMTEGQLDGYLSQVGIGE